MPRPPTCVKPDHSNPSSSKHAASALSCRHLSLIVPRHLHAPIFHPTQQGQSRTAQPNQQRMQRRRTLPRPQLNDIPGGFIQQRRGNRIRCHLIKPPWPVSISVVEHDACYRCKVAWLVARPPRQRQSRAKPPAPSKRHRAPMLCVMPMQTD